jgi:signal transduction histidine kinase
VLFGMVFGVALRAPGAKGGFETAAVLCALFGLVTMIARLRRERTARDALLVVAASLLLLMAFTIHAAPVLGGLHDPIAAIGIRLAMVSLIAAAFLGAAFVPRLAVAGNLRWRLAQAGLLVLATIVAAAALDVIVAGGTVRDSLRADRIESIARGPLVVLIELGACAVLSVAAVRFALVARAGALEAAVLAAVAVLLLGAWVGFVAHPAMPADAVGPADALRLAAGAVLLAFGAYGYWQARAEDQRAAVRAERERIASDLHDSLAQDLAIIAVHAQRLETELGMEHPLALASRGALAASRGVIADLAAAEQPTAEAALRQVAADLSARFGVRVVVRVGDGTGDGGNDFVGGDREQLVRIAREAIVNAARHGRAQTITVLLDRSRPLRLVVTDDGCGINESMDTAGSGFGLTMMRARAGRLGASLSVKAVAAGGTEVEVLGR